MSDVPYTGGPACGDPTCQLLICMGPESHGVNEPWYMTQKPIVNPKQIQPDPIVLLKMDGWVLEKWKESDTESNLWQYCPSTQWKKEISVSEVRAGMCDSCYETIPEEMVAAYTMHNWTMLQKYDADMKKYGADLYNSMVDGPPGIQVYR